MYWHKWSVTVDTQVKKNYAEKTTQRWKSSMDAKSHRNVSVGSWKFSQLPNRHYGLLVNFLLSDNNYHTVSWRYSYILLFSQVPALSIGLIRCTSRHEKISRHSLFGNDSQKKLYERISTWVTSWRCLIGSVVRTPALRFGILNCDTALLVFGEQLRRASDRKPEHWYTKAPTDQ